jgi:hypothetical protein
VQPHIHKKKIINDPVYGFVTIPAGLIFELIEHPLFQRLRRIKQLGLTNMVYPGALHTRFQHVIGAMSLTVQAVDTLRSKGVEITDAEAEGVFAAVLLHDMGHGPYSHTLEHVLIRHVDHEEISLAFMQYLNREFKGRLDLAIQIFTNKYHKLFLHQLVSGQLDMDRLDYLRRDSFYTGVQEGVIGHDRIINMLHVKQGELVIEEKGIYSIEKFLIARRLMYWQVYLHKTVVAAETLLIRILERAVYLAARDETLFATPAFHSFLYHPVQREEFFQDDKNLLQFSQLDDDDVFASIKVWTSHSDKVLSSLCSQLRNRQLPKTEISHEPFSQERVDALIAEVAVKQGISKEEARYFVFTDSVMNKAYSPDGFTIQVAYRDGRILDITSASDQYNISALAKPVTKYFLCYPKK